MNLTCGWLEPPLRQDQWPGAAVRPTPPILQRSMRKRHVGRPEEPVYLVPGGRGLFTGLFTLFGLPVVLLPVEAPPAVPVLPPVVEPAVPAPVPPAPAEPAPAPPAPPAPPPPAPPPPPPPWAKAAVLKSSAQTKGTTFLYIIVSSVFPAVLQQLERRVRSVT